jgi:ecdysone 20-monooxygenase
MAACRKEENFKDAEKFIPERWLNEKGEMNVNQCVSSSIVNPFGTGKRICPGKKFSEIEIIILVIKLVRAFRIEYCSHFERVFEFVLVPKGPIDIKFADRF